MSVLTLDTDILCLKIFIKSWLGKSCSGKRVAFGGLIFMLLQSEGPAQLSWAHNSICVMRELWWPPFCLWCAYSPKDDPDEKREHCCMTKD